jgi:hypothetical protein
MGTIRFQIVNMLPSYCWVTLRNLNGESGSTCKRFISFCYFLYICSLRNPFLQHGTYIPDSRSARGAWGFWSGIKPLCCRALTSQVPGTDFESASFQLKYASWVAAIESGALFTSRVKTAEPLGFHDNSVARRRQCAARMYSVIHPMAGEIIWNSVASTCSAVASSTALA